MIDFSRRRVRLCAIGAVALCSLASCGGRAVGTPSEPDVSLEGHLSTVPITIDQGHIFAAVEVNGKPAVFVLDTAAGADVLSVTAAKRLGVIASDPKKPLVATGAGGHQQTWLAHLETLKAGGAVLRQSPVFLLDLPPILKADVLLGYEFLHRFVTTIDYQARTVTFRDAAPPSADGAAALPFVLTGNVPGIEAELDGKRGRFQIDTGDAGAIDVNTPFVTRDHLRDKYPKRMDMITGLGVGGEERSSIVRIGSLKIGSVTIANPIADLSLQKQGAFAASDVSGSLGYGVLSRFKVTLDYQSAKIVLEDAGLGDQSFPYNRSGVGYSLSGGVPTVTDVIAGSPAEQVGVRAGDQIVEINGVPMDDGGIRQLRDAVRGAPGENVRLKLRAPDKATRDITLTLRELL
ncbi:hypothetical protein CCAX7_004600 [Capsulimonas corticalis]|uniref:Uncharacterized protein n=1 Tax=Capsulimonas corticalis TaxID=2219043 RepID=A0A402D2U3_9BACT|nr:aspartyl protease family protein [Capsulimonas corticalis]BDI28409.1 hypothetical protein CCAX7_004600 [Capsulimonas corticalis]